MRRLLRLALIPLALVFLFEAWLWERLAPIVAWIVACVPLERLKAQIAIRIEDLPAAATLGIFVLPVLLLLPFKFFALWALAHGHWLEAVAWFRRLYDRVLGWLAAAHALTDPIGRRLKIWFGMFAPRRAGRTLKLLARIRRRMQAPAA